MSQKYSPHEPHISWVGYGYESGPRPRRLTGQHNAVSHLLSITLHGAPRVRRITRGTEQAWQEKAGTVHFLPADGEKHVFLSDAPDAFAFQVFFIPAECFQAVRDVEGIRRPARLQELLLHDDPVLTACMQMLSTRSHGDRHATAAEQAEASRRLIIRLHRLAGGCLPDWHGDRSVFDRRTMRDLKELIDSQLHIPPTLEDLAERTGLSPGHFSRKFCKTTGRSLLRFVNLRRVETSLSLLQTRSRCLAEVAHELGFVSQSHFTMHFRSVTGMTPARYRRFITGSLRGA